MAVGKAGDSPQGQIQDSIIEEFRRRMPVSLPHLYGEHRVYQSGDHCGLGFLKTVAFKRFQNHAALHNASLIRRID